MKKEIIIDRSQWRTGSNGPHATGKGKALLCNDLGFKCCLGFITIANGVDCTPTDRDGFSMPMYTGEVIPGLTDLIDVVRDTELSEQAAKINDEPSTTLEEKEKLLTELFKDSEYELKFVGEPVKYEE